MSKSTTLNPNGKKGEPITLAPYSFDDALRKIPGAKPDPKTEENPAPKKPRKKSTA